MSRVYFFHVAQGLRGCYMPDNSWVAKVSTRRELKSILESEAESIRDAGFIGCSRKAIAWLAAECWRSRGKFTLDYVAPYKTHGQDGYPYGLFCSAATRQDWKDQ